MWRLPSCRLFCQNGSSGRSHRELVTASAVICVQRLSSLAVAKISHSQIFAILFLALVAISLVPVESVFADEANVFVYHRFNDPRYPSTNITTEDFESHLETLKVERFTVLTLGQVVERMRAGEVLPQRCAVISVDDGYRSFLTDGWPILKRYGYPATLFVSTDTVGGADFLSWQDLRLLKSEGVEIGNHSASHAYLVDRLPEETESAWHGRVVDDLERSQFAFEKHLGASPGLFAYPYGEFSTALVGLIRDAGFTAAFGQQSGVITDGDNIFTLPRFPVGGGYSAREEFRSRLFMRSLPVGIKSPQDTVIKEDNPPSLKFYLKDKDVNENTLRCFVPGHADCQLKELPDEIGVYEVRALQPLHGRRSKYTVTASDTSGKTWYWYSQLWVIPGGRDVADQSVPR